jgi:hypothetical protein
MTSGYQHGRENVHRQSSHFLATMFGVLFETLFARSSNQARCARERRAHPPSTQRTRINTDKEFSPWSVVCRWLRHHNNSPQIQNWKHVPGAPRPQPQRLIAKQNCSKPQAYSFGFGVSKPSNPFVALFNTSDVAFCTALVAFCDKLRKASAPASSSLSP